MLDIPELRTCAEHCGEIRKMNDVELKDFTDRHDWREDSLGFCGWCRNGGNEWKVNELLFDIENDFVVTPCCHAEAAAAFFVYGDD